MIYTHSDMIPGACADAAGVRSRRLDRTWTGRPEISVGFVFSGCGQTN